MLFHDTAIPPRHSYIGLILGHSIVSGRSDFLAQRYNGGIVDAFGGKMPDPYCAIQDRAGGRVIDAQFRLQTRDRSGPAGQLDRERMHLKRYRMYLRRIERMFRPQLQAAVDRGMSDDPARKRLVGILSDVKCRAPAVGDLTGVDGRAERLQKSVGAFDCCPRSGEPFGGEQCCGEPAARGVPGIEAFAHGTGCGPESRSLGGGDSQRTSHLLPVQPEQPASARRRTEGTYRSSGRPCKAVLANGGIEQGAFDLDAQYESIDRKGTR